MSLSVKPCHQPEATARYFATEANLRPWERVGTWHGTSLPHIGITPGTQVAADDLLHLLRGHDPAVPARDIVMRRAPSRRAAHDIVLTVDKSISVAALCLGQPGETTGPDTPCTPAQAIFAAFAAALQLLADFLEYLTSYQSATGARRARTWMSAIFLHGGSRHGDPHLHAHFVVPNLAADIDAPPHYPDRIWRATDPAPWYRGRLAADALFQHDFARELRSRGLPATLTPRGPTAHPVATLPLPDPILHRLSRGRSRIEQTLDEASLHTRSGRARAAVWHDIHRPKKPSAEKAPGPTLLSAAERKSCLAALRAPLSPPPPPPPTPLKVARRIECTLAGQLQFPPQGLWHYMRVLHEQADLHPGLGLREGLEVLRRIRPSKCQFIAHAPSPSTQEIAQLNAYARLRGWHPLKATRIHPIPCFLSGIKPSHAPDRARPGSPSLAPTQPIVPIAPPTRTRSR